MRFRLALVLLLAAFAPLPARGSQKPPSEGAPWTYNIRSQLVQVYLTVTEGTRRVTGLDRSSFSLKEDGIPREVYRLDSVEVPLQIALLLDTSESMREYLRVVQEAAVFFVESLRPVDRVTLIPFNMDIQHIPQLTDDQRPIIQAIRSTQARGATKLFDALLYAMKLLAVKEGRKAIVVFSDGNDTGLSASLHLVQSAAARYGFPIYTIGAGAGLQSDSLQRILRQIAEISSGRTYYVQNPKNLRGAFEDVGEELRSAYVLNYYTDVPQDDRWHDIEITVADPRYRIHSRRGFYARTGGAGALYDEAVEPVRSELAPLPALIGPDPARVAQSAQAAAVEILQPALPDKKIETARIKEALSSQAPASNPGATPLFKVETRFVEVPVLLESLNGKEVPRLSRGDFRIHEDDKMCEIAFFRADVGEGDVVRIRDAALRGLQRKDGESALAPAAGSPHELVLGRVYLVLDNLSSRADTFLEIKRAAEKIVREQFNPFRPISVHLTSAAEAIVSPSNDLESLLERIRRAPLPANAVPPYYERTMSIYEAYLIDKGNADATNLAELRFAYNLQLQHSNELGRVDGQDEMSPEMIEREVINMSRQFIAFHSSQVIRALSGLRAAINSAAADPANYPKIVIFLSSGVVMGFGDLSGRLEHVLQEARRSGVRIFTIDAAGIMASQHYGVESSTGYLVHNAHLTSLLLQHEHGMSLEKQSSLSRMAEETGGRFFHTTNDLAGSAAAATRTSGRLFYLGYLSNQPADGKYHRIRVTSSAKSVRLHARKGYYATTPKTPQAMSGEDSDTEDWSAVMKLAAEALATRNTPVIIRNFEKLASKFPNEAGLWHNLGAAYLKENNAPAAIESLQKGFALAPADQEIGATLARALVAGGYTDAAAETLISLLGRHPGDIELLLNLGRIYEAASRTAAAFHVYRGMLDLGKSLPVEAFLALARTSLTLGRKIEAGLFVRYYLEHGGDPSVIQPWRQQLNP